MLADDGERYWCKVTNNPQSQRVPTNEQLVARLGELIGAPVCTPQIVKIPGALVGWEFRPGLTLSEGWAHGSLALDPVIETHTLDNRPSDDNARRHAGIYALHDWLAGQDPQWLTRGAETEYFSHDHGHYLPSGPDWTPDTLRAAVGTANQLGVPASGVDAGELERLAGALEAVTRQDLEACASKIPAAWPVTDDELGAFVSFAFDRRQPVADRLRASLARYKKGSDMAYHYSMLRFVPDPARGEFVNFGLLVGDDDSGEWELRVIQNYRRAKAIDDRGALNLALGFVDRLESHIDALERLPETASVEPISAALVQTLTNEMRNVVQLSEPAPVAADSAQEALDMLVDELLVDPLSRRYRFEKKHRAVGLTRRAYRERHVPDESIAQRTPVVAGPYDGVFDFAVFNGEVVQLVQCWSFQLPDQAQLAEQVKAWAWVVRELRNHGGEVRVGARHVEVPSGEEIEIAAVAVPPAEGQEDVHAYDEARAAFAQTGVRELRPEDADEVAASAAKRLHVFA